MFTTLAASALFYWKVVVPSPLTEETLRWRTATGYRLAGCKLWITNAAQAGFFLLFAKTS
jgi:hypothetical protein